MYMYQRRHELNFKKLEQNETTSKTVKNKFRKIVQFLLQTIKQ